MPATTTLATTTLAVAVGVTDTLVKLGSTAGVTTGTRLFIDGEQMAVTGFHAVDPWVLVKRGADGTGARVHASNGTVYIGRADQFYSEDPVGKPPAEILVSPYINLTNGSIWFAEGDTLPLNDSNRWWQRVSTTYGFGPLGVRTSTSDPTAST